jgi:acetyl-CoA carboxylase carboxyltransferase component
MGEVLIRIVDDSRLAVFKPKYGRNMITAWAKIVGELLQGTLVVHPRADFLDRA